MAISTRQRELFAGETWDVLYRSFSSINFNASDPPSINAALRAYIQANYPEDFNDWIAQSEFVAIIDLLSWIAGTLAFKTDIAVRENFLETAEARESVLRLARFLSYNATRCQPATGVLKIVGLSTDDDVLDSFGINLNGVQVRWNNPDDSNWYERFVALLNNAFISTNPFGIPLKQGSVQTVATQLYRLNGLVQSNQLGFSASPGGDSMGFELCNADFDDKGSLYERAPNPSAAMHLYNMNDGNGNGSARTGFFTLFKQGVSGYQDYTVGQPVANQVIDIASGNINQNDVWVQTITDAGSVITDWVKVPIVLDSNITYNALPVDQRNIFSVVTRDNDQITVRFSDGLYGNAPTGNIRVSYRVSNGLSYTMKPLDVDSVRIPFSYLNPQGIRKTLYMTMSLQEQVGNATTAETIQQIRERAPQVYATQNRMVSGEDYNTFPLQANLARRIKAVNRVYSGHSRYIDLHDPTGTYQDLSLFEDDGLFFAQSAQSYAEVPLSLNLTAAEIISRYMQPAVASVEMGNAVRDLMMKNVRNNTIQTPVGLVWNQSLAVLYGATGWVTAPGVFPPAATALILPGAQIQFRLPDGTRKWAAVIALVATPNTIPVAATNGPVTLTDAVPTGSAVISILPRFIAAITPATMLDIAARISKRLSFALTYDYLTGGGVWEVVAPVAALGNLTLIRTSMLLMSVDYLPGGGSLTGLFRIVGQGITYVFESIHNVEFYDDGARAIDQLTGQASIDQISILKVNEDRNDSKGGSLRKPVDFTIGRIFSYEDGTVEPRRTNVGFADTNGYGYPNDPETFYRLVDNTTPANNHLFWRSQGGVFDKPYVSAATLPTETIVGYDTQALMLADISRLPGTIGYVVSGTDYSTDNTFWTSGIYYPVGSSVPAQVWTRNFSQDYRVAVGRGPNVATSWVTAAGPVIPMGDQMAFHWKHYASSDHRIDPAITNLHDIFVLTFAYDTAIRQWIKNGSIVADLPLPPTELDLRIAFATMEDFRMFSDGIIWRPVRFKTLFGNTAAPQLKTNFKVVRLPNAALSDGEIKSRIIFAINDYFDVSMWDFGETFYFTELAAYIHQRLAGVIASIVIVPLNASGTFGDDFEIECGPDEIFVSTATVANIQIINSNTPTNLRIR